MLTIKMNIEVALVAILFSGLVPVTSAVVQSQKLNVSDIARNGHKNSGFFNSTGHPIKLEFTHGKELLINAYGADYNFTDLVPMTDYLFQADKPSIPDADYFRFDAANLEDSEHGLFYARWSISAQNDPEYKEIGEDGLFVKQFTGDYNFKCPLEVGSCLGMVSRYEIQEMYPDNRPLARLVYFQILKIALLHDMANGAHDTMHATHLYIIGNVHDMVKSFTRQPDEMKALVCALTQEAVATLSQMAISTVISYIPPLAAIEFIYGNPALWEESLARMKKGSKAVPVEAFKFPFHTGGFEDWWDHLSLVEKEWFGLTGATPKSFTFDPAGIINGKILPYMMRGFTQFDHMLSTDVDLNQGYSKTVLCGGFEGDEGDRLEGNKVKLMKHLSGYFLDLEKGVRDQYRMMSTGQMIMEGGHYPTLQGLIGMQMKWVGEGSIMETIKNMEPMKVAISSALEKNIISNVIRKDGNWAGCTHHTQAQELCQIAKVARDTNSKDVSDAVKGRFCPDADDSELICNTGRWYHHKYHSHVVPFAPLHTFQTYASAYYNMTFEEAMTEAYVNFKSKKNDMAFDVQGWTLGHIDGAGMRVAFCVSDHYEIKDFGGFIMPHCRPSLAWDIPFICGDQGVDTAQWYNAIGLGIGSQPYTSVEDFGKPTQLYRDRIPRKLNTLSPYLSYMQYGRIGIQFPLQRSVQNLTTGTVAAASKEALLSQNATASASDLAAAASAGKKSIESNPRWTLMNRWKVFTGIDSDLALIQSITEGKERSEFENNVWFCGEEGRKVHSVFERERGHIDLSSHPTGRIDSHKKRCEKWMKVHAVEITGGEKGGVIRRLVRLLGL